MPRSWGLDKRSPWGDFKFSQLAEEPLYFYVGAGLSQAAGLVGWDEMARVLWFYLANYGGNVGKDSSGRRLEFPTGNPRENARLFDNFVNEPFPGRRTSTPALSHDNDDPLVFGRVALLNMLLRYRKPKAGWHKDRESHQRDDKTDRVRCGEQPLAEDLVLHSLIWRANCHGVLTPNYDMLLEHAYSLFHHGAALRSYRYNADFLRYIMSNPRFVLKLHGDINDIRTMLFDPETAWNKGEPLAGGSRSSRGRDLKEVYKTALKSGHMVYVGMGFRDRTIRKLHAHWRQSKISSKYVRVALVAEEDLPSIHEANHKARFKTEDYDDIRFLTYQKPESPSEAVRTSIDDANQKARFKTENYDDIRFLTYQKPESPSEAVRKFLSCIVDARAYITSVKKPPCEEGPDIHHKIFRKPTRRLVRSWQTDPLTCKGVKLKSRRATAARDRDDDTES